jgi:hypothetical protein
MKRRIEGMSNVKVKLSVTVSSEVLALVDKDVRKQKGTRSAVIEQWLFRAAGVSTRDSIDDATATYYRSLTPTREDSQLSRALSKAAKRIAFDDPLSEPIRRKVAS